MPHETHLRPFIALRSKKIGDRYLEQSGKGRYYSYHWTAIRSAITQLLLDGNPQDVIEVVHRVTGLQIATIKVSAKGRIALSWSYEEEATERLRMNAGPWATTSQAVGTGTKTH